MSARSRAGSLVSDESEGLYETCSFIVCLGSFWRPVLFVSFDVQWDTMGVHGLATPFFDQRGHIC